MRMDGIRERPDQHLNPLPGKRGGTRKAVGRLLIEPSGKWEMIGKPRQPPPVFADFGYKMKPRIRYGILDDFGEVIRWQLDKPSKNYRFITERVKAAPSVDWDNYEPALF